MEKRRKDLGVFKLLPKIAYLAWYDAHESCMKHYMLTLVGRMMEGSAKSAKLLPDLRTALILILLQVCSVYGNMKMRSALGNLG